MVDRHIVQNSFTSLDLRIVSNFFTSQKLAPLLLCTLQALISSVETLLISLLVVIHGQERAIFQFFRLLVGHVEFIVNFFAIVQQALIIELLIILVV